MSNPTIETAIELTPQECEACIKQPDVLRALAEFHYVKATEADGMDMSEACRWHTNRAKKLETEADRIQTERENG